MLARTESVALVGAEARIVRVEVDVGEGLPAFHVVGLPARCVKEAEHRTRSAAAASNQAIPRRRIVANLAPASLRKDGTHFDLALALGILGAVERIDCAPLEGWLVFGELALDGEVRPVPGSLAAAMECRRAGRKGMICAAANAHEAALISGIEVVPVETLVQCLDFVRGTWRPGPLEPLDEPIEPPEPDLREVRGQGGAKRALEVAAAGGHSMLMIGSPGSGKTMLARRLPSILPGMSEEESLDLTRIYSVAGMLPERAAPIRRRPFRSPHHHISSAGLIGGGAGLARPGEISLAHRGCLFLDELTLFSRPLLESLRGPLEDGVVRIARSGGAVAYPSRFSLVAAMNPCPCGYLGDARRPCGCSAYQLQLYEGRLSGPLLDRFDIQMTMSRLNQDDLLGVPNGESSAQVRARVSRARDIQRERYSSPGATNASVPKAELDAHLGLRSEALSMLGDAIENLYLTGRGMARSLRVARTIADLDDAETVEPRHIGEALALRRPDAAPGTVA